MTYLNKNYVLSRNQRKTLTLFVLIRWAILAVICVIFLVSFITAKPSHTGILGYMKTNSGLLSVLALYPLGILSVFLLASFLAWSVHNDMEKCKIMTIGTFTALIPAFGLIFCNSFLLGYVVAILSVILLPAVFLILLLVDSWVLIRDIRKDMDHADILH